MEALQAVSSSGMSPGGVALEVELLWIRLSRVSTCSFISAAFITLCENPKVVLT